MTSIVFIGPAMSGKTHMCLALAEQSCACIGKTQSTSHVSVSVNNAEWHFWDTPSASAHDITHDESWIGHDVLNEADVVIVCYDGRSSCNPMEYVQACGIDRCIILRTRGAQPCHDLWFLPMYLQHVTSHGQLVPLISLDSTFYCTIRQVSSHFQTKGSANFVALV